MIGSWDFLSSALHNPQRDVLTALHFHCFVPGVLHSARFDGRISLWHADNAMRPYVAFNAELRTAFQGCVARMEEACAALVRLVS
jgi:hypothetical protein